MSSFTLILFPHLTCRPISASHASCYFPASSVLAYLAGCGYPNGNHSHLMLVGSCRHQHHFIHITCASYYTHILWLIRWFWLCSSLFKTNDVVMNYDLFDASRSHLGVTRKQTSWHVILFLGSWCLSRWNWWWSIFKEAFKFLPSFTGSSPWAF